MTDRTVLAIMAFSSHTGGLANPSAACHDCFVVAPATNHSPANARLSGPKDPWQVDPDYAAWSDPQLPHAAGILSSVKHTMVATRIHIDDESICGDGYYGSIGGCQTYYFSPGSSDGAFGNGSPVPPHNPGSTFITVGISSAGSEGISIPGAGHLYVQEWFGSWPAMVPIGTILQAGDINGKLQFANFTQNPLTDWQAFLLDGQGFSTTPLFPGYWNTLVATKNTYQSRLSIAPAYVFSSMNSNSWAYGLLIYSNTFSATEVQQSIATDQVLSGLNPVAWPNGAALSANFL